MRISIALEFLFLLPLALFTGLAEVPAQEPTSAQEFIAAEPEQLGGATAQVGRAKERRADRIGDIA